MGRRGSKVTDEQVMKIFKDALSDNQQLLFTEGDNNYFPSVVLKKYLETKNVFRRVTFTSACRRLNLILDVDNCFDKYSLKIKLKNYKDICWNNGKPVARYYLINPSLIQKFILNKGA